MKLFGVFILAATTTAMSWLGLFSTGAMEAIVGSPDILSRYETALAIPAVVVMWIWGYIAAHEMIGIAKLAVLAALALLLSLSQFASFTIANSEYPFAATAQAQVLVNTCLNDPTSFDCKARYFSSGKEALERVPLTLKKLVIASVLEDVKKHKSAERAEQPQPASLREQPQTVAN